MNFEPWIGVDLDGTLAYYEGWQGIYHVGKPVPRMLERVRQWLSNGQKVKIFTARVSRIGSEGDVARLVIETWLAGQDLPKLEITCTKDMAMIELWDDRAVQVVANTGETLNEQVSYLRAQIATITWQ